MDKTNGGVDYNREAFLPSTQALPSGNPGLKGMLLVAGAVIVIALLCFVGYKATARSGGDTSAETREFVQLDMQISQIDDRLDQLEQENHRLAAAQALVSAKKPEAPAPTPAPVNSSARVVYRISPTINQQPKVATPDPATLQKLSALQQGLGAAQNDATANREAWQATTDRLADVAGQVGSEHGEILRSQDQLDQLLAQTSHSSLPFELHRGGAPEQLGPVTVALKSTNARNQRYTVCVYVQHACVELKDRTPFEVVQVALSRNSPPLQVIATKVVKDGITGYLEVPREAAH